LKPCSPPGLPLEALFSPIFARSLAEAAGWCYALLSSAAGGDVWKSLIPRMPLGFWCNGKGTGSVYKT